MDTGTTMQPPRDDESLSPAERAGSVLDPIDTFVSRHLGSDEGQVRQMLRAVGADSLDDLVGRIIPESIRLNRELNLGPPRSEHELLKELFQLAERNEVYTSLIGMGYHGTIVPPVIQRNVLENPGWYTQYTPYQPEIAQGRLEALLNFQTMVADLTGLGLANASLLDEATAAAEALSMCHRLARGKKNGFFVSEDCHPQTIEVVRTRARSIGVDLYVGSVHEEIDFEGRELCGVLVQYPTTEGRIEDYAALAEQAHQHKAQLVVATDLLALTLLRSPGEFGADIAIGSSQRFGVPMGYGGPHAAFLATHEKHARKMPGRLVGVSVDAAGRPGYRMAVQTREQHIKRDRATSNICTAQVLLAIMSAMYAVYHGPDGLRRIARRVRAMTEALAAALSDLGHEVASGPRFDTLRVTPADGDDARIHAEANKRRINLRRFEDGSVGISLDETTDRRTLELLLEVFNGGEAPDADLDEIAGGLELEYAAPHQRTSDYLTHPVFNRYDSEHELLRYLHRLQQRDLSLTESMIPLGSCTMKLNGTSEMLPVTWPKFADLHPFAPKDQAAGYFELFRQLEDWLAEITGFERVSLQPNAGSQGEYAGLLAIRAYHEARGETGRDVCLIPTSAHGTNPASATVAGYRVVSINCDERGDIDLDDLRSKASEHAERLGAIMITYPSTHGVFEHTIRDLCAIVHEHGGLVYMDGANLNAQLGLCRPGDMGADVAHLNLHKTFCIPHGGGGPGMGPIAVNDKLAPHLPGHPLVQPDSAGDDAIGAVAAAPYGSPSILPISWVFIALMGAEGLKKASELAILNANYMVARLRDHYDVVYKGDGGYVAHEFILDCRPFEQSAGVTIDDIAKRLMDFGFHAPTMSWPVSGTLMVEPTESESKQELDRYCDALIQIRAEIAEIERGEVDVERSALRHAPHTAESVSADEWDRPYSRERAAFPADWLREHKYWPPVLRIDNPYGDRNLICTCPPMEAYAE